MAVSWKWWALIQDSFADKTWMLVLIWITLGVLGGRSMNAGGIEYPALGNFDPDEGTIEVWFTPMADLYPNLKEGEYRSVFQLFSLQVPGHFSFSAQWSAKENRVGLHVSMNHATIRDGLHSLPTNNVKWERGQKHHVAMTWRGREMKLCIDGVEVSKRDQAAWFEGPVGDAKLVVGQPEFRDTPVVVHAVRVSRIARAELKEARPNADLSTLLLDRFDDESRITAERTTIPDVISSVTGHHGGKLKGMFHFVKEPTPGVALFAGEEAQQK